MKARVETQKTPESDKGSSQGAEPKKSEQTDPVPGAGEQPIDSETALRNLEAMSAMPLLQFVDESGDGRVTRDELEAHTTDSRDADGTQYLLDNFDSIAQTAPGMAEFSINDAAQLDSLTPELAESVNAVAGMVDGPRVTRESLQSDRDDIAHPPRLPSERRLGPKPPAEGAAEKLAHFDRVIENFDQLFGATKSGDLGISESDLTEARTSAVLDALASTIEPGADSSVSSDMERAMVSNLYELSYRGGLDSNDVKAMTARLNQLSEGTPYQFALGLRPEAGPQQESLLNVQILNRRSQFQIQRLSLKDKFQLAWLLGRLAAGSSDNSEEFVFGRLLEQYGRVPPVRI